MSAYPNINALWAAALVEALAANGVRRVVISPGSRSTPLALAVHASPDVGWVLATDERSAAFFALGEAIATREPVALVCTSGTAAANYLPAVTEASLARVPLVVVTADRPPALRGVGAAQTIDQLHLYGHAVRRFQDLPLPAPGALRAMQAQVALAAASAAATPAGPVHLNVPFEEPLAPIPTHDPAVDALAAARPAPPVVTPARPRADEAAVAAVAAAVAAAQRPLIVAGAAAAETGGAALLAWAEAAGIPVTADVGSDLRGLGALAHADAFVRGPEFARGPDLILRVGGAPTGKGMLTYLAAHAGVPAIALQPDLMGRDGDVGAQRVVVGDVADVAERLLARGLAPAPTAWRALWQAAEAFTAARIAGNEGVPDEALALLAAARALPPGGRLCLSNSLPVRHGEGFWGGEVALGRHAHTFRGANGIDGVTSQALGIAHASGAPTLLVTGDLAALHDVGGLALARELKTPVAVLVLNNDGGGIFSLLPIADATPAFEALFGTPHGLGFAPAAAMFGLPYAACTAPAEVGEAVQAALSRPGVSVIEYACSRDRTAAAQKAWNAASARGQGVAP